MNNNELGTNNVPPRPLFKLPDGAKYEPLDINCTCRGTNDQNLNITLDGKDICSYNGKEFLIESIESGITTEDIGKPLHELQQINIDGTSHALEKLYDPEYKAQTFMGLQLDEKLSSRALMAVIQQLSMMRDYEDELREQNRP